MKRHMDLRRLLFLAICCDLGLFSKRLIAPLANIVTDSLHIPGGVSTSFSLMFLVIAAWLTPGVGCGTLMGALQSVLALAFGMTGSMGLLSPIGYIIPGIVIDALMYVSKKKKLFPQTAMVLANMLASASASLTANMIVFRLSGIPLLLYLSVALLSGSVCGLLCSPIVSRLSPLIRYRVEI